MRVIVLLLLVAAASAEVKLAGIFGDNMVLQRDAKLPIWGWARPGEKVTVGLAGKVATTRADGNGRWRVEMGPFKAAKRVKLTVAASSRVQCKNVAIGEVWLCSGQSNMNFQLQRAAGGKREVDEADDKDLRLATVPFGVSSEPQVDTAVKWLPAAPESAKGFSAVAYFFGCRLRGALDVPVGLIHASVGGTPAEAWTRRVTLQAHPELLPIVQRWDKVVADYPEAMKRYQEQLKKWEAAVEKAWTNRTLPIPRKPGPPPGPRHPHRASTLFNGMIAPLVPFAIRGVIWYQGESNSRRAAQYGTLFPALIRDWRRAWGERAFPFLFVQLPAYRQLLPRPAESTWAELREAQRLALREPETGMAVTIDLGEIHDIHPRNKLDVGYRLGLLAERIAYGRRVVHHGPLYASHRVQGGEVVVSFELAGGKLATRDEDPLTGFTVAGPDRVFHPAYAQIEGDKVVVFHPRVRKPAAVRYAWADYPVCNLVNAEELPASPFRTDDWPLITAGNR